MSFSRSLKGSALIFIQFLSAAMSVDQFLDGKMFLSFLCVAIYVVAYLIDVRGIIGDTTERLEARISAILDKTRNDDSANSN